MTILLLDDDHTYRRGLAAILRDEGHQVLDFETPGELAHLDEYRDVDLLITDYEMPHENGLELSKRFRDHHPRTPVVMITAHASAFLEAQAALREQFCVLRKPLDFGDLEELLDRFAPSKRT